MTWELSLEQISAGSGGKILHRTYNTARGVATDSRKSCAGALFVALRGENFDAHQFLSQAVQQGASVLLVDQWRDEWKELGVSIIKVADTLVGLQKLANFWRVLQGAKVIAVTGTNGKTTTKEFTRAILSVQYKTSATAGSLNNHWGVPLSLLSIEPDDEVAVIEMGMNRPGEIESLMAVAEPDVVGVTMVGRGHLEGLQVIEHVAQEKAEIYHKADGEATLVFNLDNYYTRQMWDKVQRGEYARGSKVTTFSEDPNETADICFQVVSSLPDFLEIRGRIGQYSFSKQIPVFGRHNVTNLMMAASFAAAIGMSPENIVKGLDNCRPTWGRNQWLHTKSGVRILFDAYNANPDSMGALLNNIKELRTAGAKWAVLGQMLELGPESKKYHFELGQAAAQAGFKQIWFIGPHGPQFEAGLEAGGFNNTPLISNAYEESLALKMASMIGNQDIVAVKGSRGVHLEKFVECLSPVDYQAKS